MKKPSFESRSNGVSRFFPIVCAAALSVFAASAGRAQSAADEVNLSPTARDRAAAEGATVVYRHAKPARTPAGSTLKQKSIAAATTTTTETGEGGPGDSDDQNRFPGDLTYIGGRVVEMAASHAIYLQPRNGKCAIILNCWGDPEGFLHDLEGSEFIHIVDQYTGSNQNNRYTVGKHAKVAYTPTPKTAPLMDADIQGVVHQAALVLGSGYGHIYHVFLPPGQDECFVDPNSGRTVCYSPDMPATFAFCGYHSSVDFNDNGNIAHVLYTVEPFQDVQGCSVPRGTPNGQLKDSTYNALSHETFETITDPDGSAWFNLTSLALLGQEIGDECELVKVDLNTGAVTFSPSIFFIGIHRYGVQPEYTNAEHACASNP